MFRAESLVSTGPDLERAGRLAAAGRWSEAAVLYRRVLEADPEHAIALTGLGMTQWRTGRREEGRATLERAVRTAPNEFLPRWNLALSYVDEEREDEAIAHFERAVRYAGVNDEIVEALRVLEYVWRQRGDRERAATMERLARRRLELRRTGGR